MPAGRHIKGSGHIAKPIYIYIFRKNSEGNNPYIVIDMPTRIIIISQVYENGLRVDFRLYTANQRLKTPTHRKTPVSQEEK